MPYEKCRDFRHGERSGAVGTLINPEAGLDACVAQSGSAYGICRLTSKSACHYAIIPRFSCSSPVREGTHFSQAPAACMQTKEARP